MWCIFLMTKLYDNSKKCFLKIFQWHPSPLDSCIFWKKHPRKKWQKIDPHYFSILEGVYFLQFFPKTTLSALKLQFVEKYLLLAILRVLEGKIAVLRVLEGFLDKSEEITFCHFFLGLFFQKLWYLRGIFSQPNIFKFFCSYSGQKNRFQKYISYPGGFFKI